MSAFTPETDAVDEVVLAGADESIENVLAEDLEDLEDIEDADEAEAAEDGAEPVAFTELGLPEELVKKLAENGVQTTFPIQAATIPDALAGRHVLGKARTGSGKTLAFGLAALANLRGKRARKGKPLALVLVPTRELAMQVSDALQPYGFAVGADIAAVYGGAPMYKQVFALRRGVELLVATPGRLTDLIEQQECDLSEVEIAILDEADQMADMGFMPIVSELLSQTDPGGQRLLFSATLDGAVDELVRQYMTDPVLHSVTPDSDDSAQMDHHLLIVEPADKALVTAEIAARHTPGGDDGRRTILFARTKLGADRIAEKIREAGVSALALHGGMTQRARTKTLADFKDGRVPVLVATDVAARGIHVDGIDLVLHVDPAGDPKDYLHRAGRTARAGESGTVVTLVLPKQRKSTVRLLEQAGVDAEQTKVAPSSETLRTLTGGRPVAEYVAEADAYHAARRAAREARLGEGRGEGRDGFRQDRDRFDRGHRGGGRHEERGGRGFGGDRERSGSGFGGERRSFDRDNRGGFGGRDNRGGFGDRDRAGSENRSGFGGRDRSGSESRGGFGNRGGSENRSGFGDRSGSENRGGFGNRDRNGSENRGSFGNRDRSSSENRGSFGNRDRSSSENRGFGDRDRSGSENRGGFGDRSGSENRGGFGDRNRSASENRGSFGDRSGSENRGGFGSRDRNGSENRGGFGNRAEGRGGHGERNDSQGRFGDRNSSQGRGFDRDNRGGFDRNGRSGGFERSGERRSFGDRSGSQGRSFDRDSRGGSAEGRGGSDRDNRGGGERRSFGDRGERGGYSGERRSFDRNGSQGRSFDRDSRGSDTRGGGIDRGGDRRSPGNDRGGFGQRGGFDGPRRHNDRNGAPDRDRSGSGERRTFGERTAFGRPRGGYSNEQRDNRPPRDRRW